MFTFPEAGDGAMTGVSGYMSVPNLWNSASYILCPFIRYFIIRSISLKKKYKTVLFSYQFGKDKKGYNTFVALHVNNAGRSVHYYNLHEDNLAVKLKNAHILWH